VEFTVSPKVGQASTACPTRELSPSKGMAQPIFPASLKLRGDIGSSKRVVPDRSLTVAARNEAAYHTWQACTGAMGCPGLHEKAF
jgi:hypothetical protein